MRTGTLRFSEDYDGKSSWLFPSALRFLFPHWSDTAPTLLAIALTGPGVKADPADPCSTSDGVKFGVKGHPEASVMYYSGNKVPIGDPTMTETGLLGLAEITGLAATAKGERLELTAEKDGCSTISPVTYPHEGKLVLEDGVLTGSGSEMPAVPWP